MRKSIVPFVICKHVFGRFARDIDKKFLDTNEYRYTNILFFFFKSDYKILTYQLSIYINEKLSDPRR